MNAPKREHREGDVLKEGHDVLPLTPYDPDRIGPYPLTHRLGTGGMGQVYLARADDGTHVVVKVVRSALVEDDRLDGTDYRARFAREAQLASRVGGRYTAEVVDSDPHSERPWIAYEHIPGPSLKDALAERGPLDPASLRALAALLAEALHTIHTRDLIHRDIKPSNIILAPDGPRVIDFGIARPTEGSTMTGTGHVFGTLPYMSPEQAEGSALFPASDMFALGTTLAQAATGHCPFDGPSEPRILMRLISPPPLEILSGLPTDLIALIRDCWAHDPALRPTPVQVVRRCTDQALERAWPPRHLGVPETVDVPSEPEPIVGATGAGLVEATAPQHPEPTEPQATLLHAPPHPTLSEGAIRHRYQVTIVVLVGLLLFLGVLLLT
ncbi:serine/threonine-protein kinase [Nocardiopsis sp. JB363]|uniref:serine/threonine-protein kinase n=1 Tax=Nocardiopsis sp. JB363 TaxID=1434837 RepID=UPI00097A54B6|nr:serine/threonine-protein kinase [Nocardiopsis sp. JB363]SIO86389.1 serine/threonine protein kinase [Nocardiopsis sp. JB363]